MAQDREGGVSAIVIYIPADGRILVERPGLDPVVVEVDPERAPENAPVPPPAHDEPPQANPIIEPPVIPIPDPVFVMDPGNIPVLRASVPDTRARVGAAGDAAKGEPAGAGT
jgi:hypothetical protein